LLIINTLKEILG